MTRLPNQKLSVDLLISIIATLILGTSILSISTNNWNIKSDNSITNRTGLFQECSNTYCCNKNELDRSITLLSLFSIILLITNTLSSFLLMSTTAATNSKTHCYILIPLTLFSAGITMTLTLIQVLDRIDINGYSAYIFIVDTVLAYLLGGISLVHGNMFYF